MVRFLRVALLLFFVSFTLLGQGEKIYNPVADSLFKSGLDFFKLGLNARIVQADTAGFRYFLNAYSNFDSVISLGLNHRTTASYIMASKSLCYLDRYRDAEKLLRKFVNEFPTSDYIEDAFYTLALIYSKFGNFKEAILKLDRAISKSKHEKSKYVEIASVIIPLMIICKPKIIVNNWVIKR